MAELNEFVEGLVKGLASRPEELEVKEIQGDKTAVFEIRAAKEDIGRIIGRKGKNIEALRSIAAAAGIKKARRTILQLIEDDEPPA